MTSPMFNPQPNYSGVTIQISNPAVNVGADGVGYPAGVRNSNCVTNPQVYCYPGQYQVDYNNPNGLIQGKNANNSNLTVTPDGQVIDSNGNVVNTDNQASALKNTDNNRFQNSYPADYYLNNYNTSDIKNKLNNNENSLKSSDNTDESNSIESATDSSKSANNNQYKNSSDEKGDPYNMQYRAYSSDLDGVKQREDLTTSRSIIDGLTERDTAIQEEKKNSKETKIVALTDEYIKSLENYLNNPNDEIRLMASKEILTRLDEDKDRYDDAALNALLNKMLQDPAKLVRIAALSAFASGLASGNNYTIQLLNNIQSNPNADKEDVLQAADILLKMSAGVEVKRIPNPAVKDNPQQQ